MRRPLASVVLVLSMLQGNLEAAPDDGELRSTRLRTAYRVDPLGIDVTVPRLSWIVESDRRGTMQAVYRVLVASSPAVLADERGDLWDSGRVVSDDSTAVDYRGTPLTSGARCYWKVKVWDSAGRESAWSEPATWTMGVLDAALWKASWIGHDAPIEDRSESAAHAIDAAKWIWYPEGNPAESAPVGSRYFRRAFELPAGKTVRSAQLAVAADNQADVYVNGERVGGHGSFSSAKTWRVADRLRSGRNTLAAVVQNVGEAANPAGLMVALRVELADGAVVSVHSDEAWKASDAESAGWEKPGHDATAWHAVKVLGDNGSPPWSRVTVPTLVLPPPRYLRKEFRVARPVRRATLYGSALGNYELRVNGKRVDDEWFSPGWTDYDQRVYYNTRDVTDRVRTGNNAIAAVLADGWYSSYIGIGGLRDHYGDRTRLFAQLELEYDDGSRQTIVTGPSWKATTGPLLEADHLMGEAYDARRAMRGWDSAGYDDGEWSAVDVTPKVDVAFSSYPGVPVQAYDSLRTVEVTEPTPGAFIFDLGQNFAGVVKLTVRGARAGQEIRLRHGEMLQPDGKLYVENLRSGRATDRYISAGARVETWTPRFTFHGFRYVEVTGYPGEPPRDAIVGIPLSSATPIVGSFECSEPMVNQLVSNIYWTQRMNFIDVPTDCPQRDERLGWTGDAQIYVRAACSLTDNQAFYTKWLVDLYDAQRDDGQFPMVAPLKSKGVSSDGGPAWADAGVICPWHVYEVYGDRRLLARHYEGMKRFVDFCHGRCRPGPIPPEKFHCFGDWLSIKANTPTDVIFMAYFAQSTALVVRAAEELGQEDDAKRYRMLLAAIKKSFNQAFVGDDGRIKGHTQTGYALALRYDLVEGERRENAIEYLIDDLRSRDWHLSTGFIGTKDLMLVLRDIGRDDVAYRLLLNETFPSWGFSIRQGATTIWERWNGWTPENGFFNPSMNSFAHYSFGAVAQWMFEAVGGIRAASPGYRELLIAPRPYLGEDGRGLQWASTSYESIRGRIATRWKIDGDVLRLEVDVPANASATLRVPTADPKGVKEGGVPAAEAEGVRFVTAERDVVVYRIGSGRYEFAAPRVR